MSMITEQFIPSICPQAPDTKSTTAAVQAFLRNLLPLDLPTNQPLYILPGEAIGLDRSSGVFGIHATNLDLAAIESIGNAWVGRGPTIALNFSAIFRAAGNVQMFDVLVIAVAIHELAHSLVNGFATGPVPTAAAPKLVRLHDKLRSRIAGDRVAPVDADTYRQDHCDRYIRAVLHLFDRVTSRPDPVALLLAFHLDWVFDAARYDLSPAWQYNRAIGDEPERLKDLSLAEILDLPAPAEFVDLYTRDLANRRAHSEGIPWQA